MDEATFLAQILAEPEDDAPRLIYADWLEERADPRGEFIRVQCERAAIGAGRFVDLASGQRWRDLADREGELLAAHGAKWAAPVSKLTAVRRFHRGFIDDVDLTVDALLSHGNSLFELTPIRRIVVAGALHAKAKRWRSLEFLSRLSRLTFRGNQDFCAFSSTLAGLDSLRNLRELAIEGAYVNVSAVRALAYSPHLASLSRLSFVENSFDDECVKALAVARNLGGLRGLAIARNRFVTTDGASSLATSPFIARLESLDLRETSVGNGASAYLAFSPNLRKLTQLNLARSLEGGPEAVAPLADSSHLPLLESLMLEGNRLGDAGIEALSRSRHFESLRFVDLGRNEISNAGAAILAQWPRLSQLSVLDLRYNDIDAAGAAMLAESPQMAPQCVIRIAKNPISASERKELERRYPGRFARVFAHTLAGDLEND